MWVTYKSSKLLRFHTCEGRQKQDFHTIKSTLHIFYSFKLCEEKKITPLKSKQNIYNTHFGSYLKRNLINQDKNLTFTFPYNTSKVNINDKLVGTH